MMQDNAPSSKETPRELGPSAEPTPVDLPVVHEPPLKSQRTDDHSASISVMMQGSEDQILRRERDDSSQLAVLPRALPCLFQQLPAAHLHWQPPVPASESVFQTLCDLNAVLPQRSSALHQQCGIAPSSKETPRDVEPTPVDLNEPPLKSQRTDDHSFQPLCDLNPVLPQRSSASHRQCGIAPSSVDTRLEERSGQHDREGNAPGVEVDRFRREPASRAAVQHSVTHEVISQVIRPDMAAFIADKRVVARTHDDELCCVDTVAFTAVGSELGPVDIEYLQQFPHLIRLYFEEKTISATGLALVAKLSQLQHLDLSECSGVDAAGLVEIRKLSCLRRLDLRCCRGVDAAALAAVGNLSQLEHLDLRGCYGVDAAGLAELAKLSRLQHLDIAWCQGVDAAGLAAIVTLLHLQRLDLNWCDGVDAAGLAEVAKLKRLQRLDLSSCNGVDAAGLAQVGKMTRLEHLALSWCAGVDTAGLAELGRLKTLRYLNISECGVDTASAEVAKLTASGTRVDFVFSCPPHH